MANGNDLVTVWIAAEPAYVRERAVNPGPFFSYAYDATPALVSTAVEVDDLADFVLKPVSL